MTLTRSRRLAVAALAAGGAMAVALISTAGDAGARGKCPNNKLCIWEDEVGGGQLVTIGGKGVSNKLAEKMNNKASSLINGRPTKVFLYAKRDGKGESRCFPPGAEVETLADFDFDDVASSTKIAKGTTCPMKRSSKLRRADPCPENTLCLFEDVGGGGQRVRIKGKGISNKIAEKMNDQATSVINNRAKRAILYEKRDGKGDDICLSPGDSFKDLGAFGDLASSSKNTSSADPCPP